MRTLSLLAAICLAGASVGACKWTDFDDLEKDTWVSVTSKPNGDSTDYGVAIQRGSRMSPAGGGGKLVAIGAGDAQFTEIVYATNGDSDLAPTALKLNNQFGVGNLDPTPILLADPTSDEVALVTNAGGQSIAVLSGVGGLVAHQLFGPEQPDAAAYMLAPTRLDPAGAAPHASQPIVAAGDSVYGTFYVAAPPSQPKCQLLDDTGTPMLIRGLGGAAITGTTTDDVVVWGAVGNVGKLLLYSGGVFNGQPPVGPCTAGMSGPLPLSMAVDTSFAPGKGSQIIMIDRRYALLVGRKDNDEGYIALYDVTTMAGGMRVATRLGVPIDDAGLRSAAVLDIGTAKYVVAGYPGATVEAVKAGKVVVFPLDLTTGVDATPAMTLYDAQPEGDQYFGRTVAVTPYNGSNVIAVGADNEVFLYFRTLLYDDTRQ